MKLSKGEICYNCFKTKISHDEKIKNGVDYISNYIQIYGYQPLDEYRLNSLLKQLNILLYKYSNLKSICKSWSRLENAHAVFLQSDFNFEIYTGSMV